MNLSLMGHFAPRPTDWFMEKAVLAGTLTGMPRGSLDDNSLEQPTERLTERGNYPGHVMRRSFYTRAALHPYLLIAMLAGAGLATSALMAGNGRRARSNGRLTHSSGSPRPQRKRLSAPRGKSPATRSAAVHARH